MPLAERGPRETHAAEPSTNSALDYILMTTLNVNMS